MQNTTLNFSLTIGMVGAFDTKEEDYSYLRQQLIGNGCKVIAINIGVFERAISFPVDITCEALLQPEKDLKDLRLRKDRPYAVKIISNALIMKIASICQRLGIQALIGMGGTNGTSIITSAMQKLPRSMPKICISTLAQHENWEFTKTANIILLDSCVDVGGLNSISREKYAEAAVIISSLAKKFINQSPVRNLEPKKPAIGISMFGNTTKCVERCSTLLRENFEIMPFHAVGSGGKNLESLVREGTIRGGVLDITLQEIGGFLFNGIFSAGKNRLKAPAETRTPHVIIPGCVDMVILGNIKDARKRFSERFLYKCNENITALRTNKKGKQKNREVHRK